MNNIEKMFSAFQTQVTLIKQKTTKFHNRQVLELMKNIIERIDNLLQNAVKKTVNDYQYLNVLIEKKFKLKKHLTVTDMKKQ